MPDAGPPITELVVLVGFRAIGLYLNLSAATVSHLHRQRLLPTFRVGGTPCATPAGLDDWQVLRSVKPTQSAGCPNVEGA